MNMIPITLEQLLLARSRRADKQREILARHALPLISYTLCIPGNVKQSDAIKRLFMVGLQLLKTEFQNEIRFYEVSHEQTGSVAYISVDDTPENVKRRTVRLDTESRFGRLFDMDVIAPTGEPMSRTALGFPPRPCFVCGETGAACARSEAHTKEEIISAINKIYPIF